MLKLTCDVECCRMRVVCVENETSDDFETARGVGDAS